MRCASARTSSTRATFVARSRLQRPCGSPPAALTVSAEWRAGTGPGRTPADTARPTRGTDARVVYPLRRIGTLNAIRAGGPGETDLIRPIPRRYTIHATI
ncbi:hypothetical protein BD309DRAFT_955206 [Dichomitus squalens]|nr:hypothetical protein BD309DRAFT_955206 [Dichomitus squalens]